MRDLKEEIKTKREHSQAIGSMITQQNVTSGSNLNAQGKKKDRWHDHQAIQKFVIQLSPELCAYSNRIHLHRPKQFNIFVQDGIQNQHTVKWFRLL